MNALLLALAPIVLLALAGLFINDEMTGDF